jgi:hypothetical protein
MSKNEGSSRHQKFEILKLSSKHSIKKYCDGDSFSKDSGEMLEVMTIFLGGKSSIKMSMATAGFHSHICIRFDHNHVVHITVEDGDGTHFDGHTTGRWSSAWINSKFPKNK